MVFFNYSTMQMAAKVVYYGPGLCGKTTNLQYIYSRTAKESRGEMVSLETETDRTLFFDLLPIDVGSIAGFSTRIQLYTVPGQVFYNTTRKLVLKGVDGVVFVADSQRPMLQANIDSFRNLEENFQEMGLAMENVPLVLQYNKRDLHDIASVEELNQALNRGNWPYFESSALTGTGVFETLKGISKLTLLSLKKRLSKDAPARPQPVPRPQMTPRPAPAPPPEPAPVPVAPRPHQPPPTVAAVPARPPAAVHAPPPAPPAAPPRAPAPHAPAAAAPARPAPPAAKPPVRAPAPKPKTQSDVLAELEKIRKQALRPPAGSGSVPAVPAPAPARPAPAPPPAAPAPPPPSPAVAAAAANGKHEINREIQLTLNKVDFERARRFLLSLQVEDGQHQVVEALHDFQVDLGALSPHQKVVLRLNIALRSKE